MALNASQQSHERQNNHTNVKITAATTCRKGPNRSKVGSHLRELARRYGYPSRRESRCNLP
jgi:hypothetical protein